MTYRPSCFFSLHTKLVLTIRSENVAERAQAVWERSGRGSNFLRSVYELHGRAQSGSDWKGAPGRVDPTRKILVAIPCCS